MSERFWSRVKVVGECWEWQRRRDKDGYGVFCIGRKNKRAHRVAYEEMIGEIPDGLVLDHIVCDNPPCVNPYHVMPATSRFNTVRTPTTFPGQNIRKTRCPKGHDYAVHGRTARSGSRYCKVCKREHAKRYIEKPGRREEVQEARTAGYWANPERYRALALERYYRSAAKRSTS